MGEITEAILEGLFCQICGGYLDGNEPGYPRTCEICEKNAKPSKKKKRKKKVLNYMGEKHELTTKDKR